MGPQKGICRLCLKICDKFRAIEVDMKDALNVLLLKMDFAAMQKPVVCTNCTKMIIKCYDFKSVCFCTRDYIIPLVNSKDAVKLNLKDVYQTKNENEARFLEDHDICGFCMIPVKKCSAISVDIENGDVTLKHMIRKCLPELDLCIIEKPVICTTCHSSLENCFHFVTNCLIVEENIRKYRESLDVNSKNLIELSGLLQFTMRDITTSEVNGSSVEAIKAEKQFCEEIENAGKREIGKGEDIFKLEQMPCEDDEYVKEEVEYISNMDLDDLKFNNGEQFIPEDVLACKEERSNFDVIKTEERFCEEKELIEENLAERDDQKFLLNEEMEIKTEELDFDRFENGTLLPQSEVTTKLHRRRECLIPNLEEDLWKPYIKSISTIENPTRPILYKCDSCLFHTYSTHYLKSHLLTHRDKEPPAVTMYKCGSCSYQTRRKYHLKIHLLVHKDPSEVTMYKCDSCSYQAKRKVALNKHLLVHKDPSEVTVYKCDSCSYQTKHKIALKTHLLVHKNLTEVTIHKCDACSFQTKWKASFKKHLLVHKDPSEVTVYKCDSCSYQTVWKHVLKMHLLVHKDPAQVTMYKCDSCSYQAIKKSSIKRHLLVHKDPSEVTMHKCDICSFQTKRKDDLGKHFLVHKDSSEVAVHKCDSCSFETKRKDALKKHLLVHKGPSELTVCKCGSCSYQTGHKDFLKMHLLVHKDSSEVTVYNCDSCSFQTKQAGDLKKHFLVHKDPPEVTIYKCDFCSFQTRHKNVLKMHLLVHKDSSEVTMYNCDSCSYQTKHKGNLKTHLRVHKSPSEVTMYKCDSCSFQTKYKYSFKMHLLLHSDPSVCK